MTEVLYERVSRLARAVPRWIRVDRREVIDRIVLQVVAQYRTLPAPEPIEGAETGLEFIRLLMREGSDHGLYEAAMQQLDSDIHAALQALPDDDLIALLMPMEAEDVAELFTDRDIDEWPYYLLNGQAWPDIMRRAILNRIVNHTE